MSVPLAFSDIKVSTKCAEGAFIGSKFGLVYSALYAPFASKESSLANGTSRGLEYFKQVGRASGFFCMVMSGLFGIKQFIAQNKKQ